jgi:hypothetical protein
MAQIWINTSFKLFRLVMIIFLISYYTGMSFYVFADVLNDMKNNESYDSENLSYNHEDFITYFDIDG